MSNIAVRKTQELHVAERAAFENLLGRKLREDERVTVLATLPHPAPPEPARRAVLAHLEQIMDTAAANTQGVPAEEIDAAIGEAMEQVRRWKE